MISAYTGLTGSGKTLSMVRDAFYLSQRFPRPIFSNFNINFPLNLEQTVLKSRDFVDCLLSQTQGLFLVDEAGFVFNSRKWTDLPFELVARFQQSRKIGIDIMYTTQNIRRVDLTLRELTHRQIMCKFEKIILPSLYFENKKPNFKMLEYDLFLRNSSFFNPIIDHDSKENRKLWNEYNRTILVNEFKKFYKMYDTLELIQYTLGDEATR